MFKPFEVLVTFENEIPRPNNSVEKNNKSPSSDGRFQNPFAMPPQNYLLLSGES